MTKMIKIVNLFDGTEIEREMTAEELVEYEAQALAHKEEKLKQAALDAEARLVKVSAYEKLGLTEAEIEALLPTPKPGIQHNL